MTAVAVVQEQKVVRPLLRLVDPETGKKIRLQLRKMAFAKEVNTLPGDVRKLHEILIAERNSQNASVYNTVMAWSRLSRVKDFWKTFGFGSEEEYIAYYGLSDGSTLAHWTSMVSLFDKPTFVLLGTTVLAFMMRAVSAYQENSEERKRDYQTIFAEYAEGHEGFEKEAFYDTVRKHVKERYEEPIARRKGMNRTEWLAERHRTLQKRGLNGVARYTSHGVTAMTGGCPACASKRYILSALKTYTKKLEAIIVKRLGVKALPPKPSSIQHI